MEDELIQYAGYDCLDAYKEAWIAMATSWLFQSRFPWEVILE